MKKTFFTLISLSVLSSCVGTGSDYNPIVDGKGPNYYNDLAECKTLSKERSYIDGNSGIAAGGTAALGAVAGALVGGNIQSAAVGAGIGAGAGLGASAIENHQSKQYIIKKCMKGRGYNVLD